MRLLSPLAFLISFTLSAADQPIRALIIDGRNNHDWAAGTRAIRSILEGTDRFTVDVCTYPDLPNFAAYQVVISNFNSGHTADALRWPRETEQALVDYVKRGGGFVAFHAANNAFLNWPEYNDMIGLLWRPKNFGPGLAINPEGQIVTIPKGQGLDPGHGPRHDFEMRILNDKHPITRGLPTTSMHPSEQLTHGQHGPATGLDILTYAYSPVSHQGEPMDWVRTYGQGRVYVTLQGHTWKDETNPNLDDPVFQAMFARGVEWAAFGVVNVPPDLGWKPLFQNGLKEWETRGNSVWTVMPDGAVLGQRKQLKPEAPFPTAWPIDEKTYQSWVGQQAWLYTKKEYDQFDLHVEYFLPIHGNSGVSIRDQSRAHTAIGESDSERPELAKFKKTTPAHVGYEIQLLDYDDEKYPTGSIYGLVPAKTGLHRPGQWNTIEIESRHDKIRVTVNGQLAAEGPGAPDRPNMGPIGLQLHDQFTFAMFRNARIRER